MEEINMATEQAETPLGGESLPDLYHCYTKFMGDLVRERGEAPPVKDYAAFVEWWSTRDEPTRAILAADYRRGLERVLEDKLAELRRG